ncbi:thiaminase II [Terrarubrum flagellatum]|uniref:thiaminase II n=1 Tax=Terrirubrum flagellatum TaxID=2895980 RepID=UPI0031456C7E
MTFSADAWRRNEALYETIRTMPFNRELADGSLGRDRFLHYMKQDAHYLVAFGRCLAVAAAKAPTPDMLVQLTGSARAAVEVERSLHEGFFKAFGVSAEEFTATEMSPACSLYTNFLLATAHQDSFAVTVAALLPCFWIYAEVGRDILAKPVAGNPYQAWIDAYGGEEFQDGVARMIGLVDDAARDQSPATIASMHRAFTMSTKMEWMFWDSAYRLESWPV